MSTRSSAKSLFNWRFRIRASLIHLTTSGTLAAFVAALVFAVWYPGAYRQMSGGRELFFIVAGVDVAVGPLITLLVFDSRKQRSHLLTDIAVISVLQLTALAYGLHTVTIARPVVLALEEDRFRIVAANDVYLPELSQAPRSLRSLPLFGPQVVYSALPTDPQKKSDALILGFKGYDIGSRPALWQEWKAPARKRALTAGKPIAGLKRRYPARAGEIDAIVARLGRSLDKVVYIPTITLRGDWVTLLDGRTADVIGFAPFDGF